MWATKSSWLGAEPSQIITAPIAMCPLCLSLARNEVSNDVSLSIWRWAIALLPGSSVAQPVSSAAELSRRRPVAWSATAGEGGGAAPSLLVALPLPVSRGSRRETTLVTPSPPIVTP